MSPRMLRRAARVPFLLVLWASLMARPAQAQRGAVNGEWRHWGGDIGSTRYSALDQIGRGNAGSLQVVWRWKAANFGPDPETYYRATPLFANGVLYTVAGERRAVVAIHAGSGETLWMWRMDEGPRWVNAPRRFSGRGLAHWTDGREERIIVVTPGYFMAALDARTGRPVPSFGQNGIVDLQHGLGYEQVPLHPTEDRRLENPGPNHTWWGIDPLEGRIGSSSPPIVVKDVIVVGNSAVQGYYPRRLKNIPGSIRGFDVRSGKQL